MSVGDRPGILHNSPASQASYIINLQAFNQSEFFAMSTGVALTRDIFFELRGRPHTLSVWPSATTYRLSVLHSAPPVQFSVPNFIYHQSNKKFNRSTGGFVSGLEFVHVLIYLFVMYSV